MGRRGRITFGVAAGILSLGVDGLAGIGLVHLLFKYLPDREAGFWSLVTVAGTFLLLLPNSLFPGHQQDRGAEAGGSCFPADG
jgi:hypothetical protein